MKKVIQHGLLMMSALIAFSSPLAAQDIQKEMADLAKQYEDAYNKKDDKALKAMYTADAVRTYSDGRVDKGAEVIGMALVEELKATPLTLAVTPGKAETAADGSVSATGTYHVTGSNGGNAFDIKGSYVNTVVKVDGKWKIAKSDLTQN